jgi:hypothetical protein
MVNCCPNRQSESISNNTNVQDSETEFYLNKDLRSNERMSICLTCENLKLLNFCSQCGCQMNIKTRIFWAQCPIGRW